MTAREHRGGLDSGRERDRFDPVAEGERHGLGPDVSMDIWDQLCRRATDEYGRVDEAEARSRFHRVAERAALRGGRLRLDPGKRTRLESAMLGRWATDDLFADPVPGRHTRIQAEERRWKRQSHGWARIDGAGTGAILRREAASFDPDADPDALAEALTRRGRGGAPLPDDLREEMERRLGADLRGVRLHSDAAAARAAAAIGARAFTVGEDIYFAPGELSLAEGAGRELLAHELTHVVQAQRGQVSARGPGLQVSDPDDDLEREARTAGARIAYGGNLDFSPFQPVRPCHLRRRTRCSVRRKSQTRNRSSRSSAISASSNARVRARRR